MHNCIKVSNIIDLYDHNSPDDYKMISSIFLGLVNILIPSLSTSCDVHGLEVSRQIMSIKETQLYVSQKLHVYLVIYGDISR